MKTIPSIWQILYIPLIDRFTIKSQNENLDSFQNLFCARNIYPLNSKEFLNKRNSSYGYDIQCPDLILDIY